MAKKNMVTDTGYRVDRDHWIEIHALSLGVAAIRLSVVVYDQSNQQEIEREIVDGKPNCVWDSRQHLGKELRVLIEPEFLSGADWTDLFASGGESYRSRQPAGSYHEYVFPDEEGRPSSRAAMILAIFSHLENIDAKLRTKRKLKRNTSASGSS